MLTALVAGPAALAGPPAAAPAAGEIVLPSERCGDLFIVPLTTAEGASATLDMLLDTGSRWTLVDPQSLRRALGGRLAAGRVTLAESRVGDHRLPPLRIRPLEMDAFGLAIGRRLDGILGFPAFADVLLTLDYPAAEVRVAAGSLPPPDGRTVLRDVGSKRPQVRLEAGGRRLELLVDSGSTRRFLFKPSDRLLWSAEPRPVATAFTAYGLPVDASGRLAGSLRLGPGRFDRPIVTVATRERTVGGAALRHFAVTFDQRNDRIGLRTAESAPLATLPLVGSGLGFRPRREGLEVVAVFPGTPARAAGFEAGDLIVAIDGVPVHERACGDREAPAAGTLREFAYLRDGVPARATLEYGVLVP